MPGMLKCLITILSHANKLYVYLEYHLCNMCRLLHVAQVPYTIELARRIDREVPGGVKWIENIAPDDYEGYAEVKRKAGHWNLFTCGNEYTRYGFRRLIEEKCHDVLQPTSG